MKEQISPWSIYDNPFKKIQQRQQNELLTQKSGQIPIKSKPSKHTIIPHLKKIATTIDVSSKDSQKIKQQIGIEKGALDKNIKQLMIIKIIKQQLKRQERNKNQKRIANTIKFSQPKKNREKQVLEFPKISNNAQSVLIIPQIKEQSKNNFQKNGCAPFDDKKMLQRSIDIYNTNKIKRKKLSSLILYQNH